MDYSKLIKEMVALIRAETGMTQEEIGQELGKADNYISTVINRGGNEKAYQLIRAKYADLLAKHLPGEDLHVFALLRALLEDYVLLKSEMKNRPPVEIRQELERRAMLVLEDLKKGR